MVVLLRTAHTNMSKLKDVYMHQNTLAALANLAPDMSAISSYAAQRLVSLFDMLSRRCALLRCTNSVLLAHTITTYLLHQRMPMGAPTACCLHTEILHTYCTRECKCTEQ